MLSTTALCFVLAVLAYVLGAGGIAGITMILGKSLLVVFLILGFLSFADDLFRHPERFSQT